MNDPYRNAYCNCNQFLEEPCGNVNCNIYNSYGIASNYYQRPYDPTCNTCGNSYGNQRCCCERCNNPYTDPAFYGYDTFPQPGYNQPYCQPGPVYPQPPNNEPPIIIINDDDDVGDRCLTDEIMGLLLTSLINNNNNVLPPPPPSPSYCGGCNCNNKNNCNSDNDCNKSNDNNCNSGNKCSMTVQITIVLPKSDDNTKPSVTIS
ncbi:hypothetical protein HF086_005044 [Spodoptera exigua]|uniref:Uncharacterized protein n=1 Tax=Spodoptera exigua TaxID=7107 RepID=A0A922MLM1_SPOEX|nr:hypothetical protein HF086_005044 [Spodoptera exigua]